MRVTAATVRQGFHPEPTSSKPALLQQWRAFTFNPMPYKPTQERYRYLERTEPRPLPIEGDTIQIGKYRGKTTDYVRKKDPGWFKWACENVRDFKTLAASESTEL